MEGAAVASGAGAAAVGVSDEMRALFEAQRKAHETVLTLQQQVEEEEEAYLEETPHGNIIRGWDGFVDSKPPRKDSNPKKIKPYTESEHLFSGCCFYRELAAEPSFGLVDIYSTTSSSDDRRKATASPTTSSSANTSASSRSHDGSSHASHASTSYRGGKGSKLGSKLAAAHKASERKAHLDVRASGKGGKGAATHHPAKLKKRKRDKPSEHVAGETPSSAKNSDVPADKEPRSATTTTTTAARSSGTQKPDDDFLDVF